MNRPVDDIIVRRMIADAIGSHACLRDAQVAGTFVIPVRDRAIEICMPLAPRTVEKLTNIPWSSRVEFADLEGAANQGIVEGIDRYQPARLYKGNPIKPSTYLFLWIRKRVYEEIASNHWSIMRPGRAQMESYMKGELDALERDSYLDDYIRPVASTEWNDAVDTVGRWDGERDRARRQAAQLSL